MRQLTSTRIVAAKLVKNALFRVKYEKFNEDAIWKRVFARDERWLLKDRQRANVEIFKLIRERRLLRKQNQQCKTTRELLLAERRYLLLQREKILLNRRLHRQRKEFIRIQLNEGLKLLKSNFESELMISVCEQFRELDVLSWFCERFVLLTSFKSCSLQAFLLRKK